MAARRRFTDAERRARLVARHHLARTAADCLEAVHGLVALHSTDPASPYLGLRARMQGFTSADLDRALYEDRTLWRAHAMRRTLFVIAAEDAGLLDAAVGREIARKERSRVEGWLAAEMDPDRVRPWLADLEQRVLDVLGEGEWRTQELTAALPDLQTQITVGSGKWSARSPLSSRLLFLAAMDGLVVRARPAGSWRSSQYRWASAPAWFGGPRPTVEATAGSADLARRYLRSHGPATLADLRWWTGWTQRQAASALRDVSAVAVDLESGEEAFVLADDVDQSPEPSHVALLPALDSTPMGWKERHWYAGAHVGSLWDRNGNVGPTVWADGRIVGGWAQRPDGEVVWRLLEDVGRQASQRVAEEAAALTEWMGGVAVIPRFRTPLERELSG